MARAPAPIFDRMHFDSYVFREYPKSLYAKRGAKVETRVVKTEEEEKALVGDWFSTKAEAENFKFTPPSVNSKAAP